MPTYLNRYLAGDTQGVWDEIGGLVTADLSVEDKQDVQAVCDETMARVRQNAETLVRALSSIGFEFGLYPDGEKAFGYSAPLTIPKPDVKNRLRTLESLVGELPMSLRAFWQQIGSIWLIGRHPEFPSLSDPLVVEDIENTFFELQSWQEMVAQEGKDAIGPFRAVIAPDDYHKDNVSGGDWYGIALPCRTVDAKLLSESHETTFVNYLRLTFQAKGFPGAARLPDALENLDIGLIEI